MVDIRDYPVGDGQPDCGQCRGRGVVAAMPHPGRLIVGGRTVPCQCILARDILRNVERGWKGLTLASPIPDSPLNGHEAKNLRITGSHKAFREHLRHVAVRQGPKWNFAVVSDADLMDSWLARIDDPDIIDADVSQIRRQPVTSKYGALVDLIEPPELLIIVAGIKAARNSAMPEVMLEVLQHRAHLTKATWVVDQPEYRMAAGHISYSEHIGNFLEKWKHINLGGKPTGNGSTPSPQRRGPTPMPNRVSPISMEDTPKVKKAVPVATPPVNAPVEERNTLQEDEDARQAARDAKRKWK